MVSIFCVPMCYRFMIDFIKSKLNSTFWIATVIDWIEAILKQSSLSLFLFCVSPTIPLRIPGMRYRVAWAHFDYRFTGYLNDCVVFISILFILKISTVSWEWQARTDLEVIF